MIAHQNFDLILATHVEQFPALSLGDGNPFVTSQVAHLQYCSICQLHFLKTEQKKYDGLFLPSLVVHSYKLLLELNTGE